MGVKPGERRWPSRSAAGKLPHLLAECPHSFLSQAEWPTLMWVFLCGNSHRTSLPHHITTHSGLKEMFLHHSTSRGFHLAVWEPGPKQQAFPASSRLLPAPPRRSTDSSHQPLHPFSSGGQPHWTRVTARLIWQHGEKLVEQLPAACNHTAVSWISALHNYHAGFTLGIKRDFQVTWSG